MAYKVIILYRLYMPPYFLGTFTEYPFFSNAETECRRMTEVFILFFQRTDGISGGWYPTIFPVLLPV